MNAFNPSTKEAETCPSLRVQASMLYRETERVGGGGGGGEEEEVLS